MENYPVTESFLKLPVLDVVYAELIAQFVTACLCGDPHTGYLFQRREQGWTAIVCVWLADLIQK